MSEDTKVEKTAEVKAAEAKENFAVKVQLLVDLLKKGDKTSMTAIKFLKLKLTAVEWKTLLDEKKIKNADYELCTKSVEDGGLNMVKKATARTYKPKGDGKPRAGRFDETPAKAVGDQFIVDLTAFLESKKDVLAQIESGSGYSFHPYWRNELNAGKGRGKKAESEATV